MKVIKEGIKSLKIRRILMVTFKTDPFLAITLTGL